MVEAVPYRPEHSWLLDLKEGQLDERLVSGDVPGTVTMLREGQVLAIWGGLFVAPGVYQIWSMISKRVAEHPVEFTRASIRQIDRIFETGKVHRVQMSVRAGDTNARKFAQTLGFRYEGVMRGYGPKNTDYWLMGRAIE